MANEQGGTASIVGLNHDFKTKRSFVVIIWDDDPTKHLSLPVKFGCTFEELPAAADAAVKALSREVAELTLHLPG